MQLYQNVYETKSETKKNKHIFFVSPANSLLLKFSGEGSRSAQRHGKGVKERRGWE